MFVVVNFGRKGFYLKVTPYRIGWRYYFTIWFAETVEIDHGMEDHQELLKRTDLISEEVPAAAAANSDSDKPVKSRVVRMHIVP